MPYRRLHVYSDGGSRGNPGPSATGILICDEVDNILKEYSEFIGETTNNRAEYRALIKALEIAQEFSRGEISCFLDSELVVRQLNNIYRVKSPYMRKLLTKVRKLEGGFEKVIYKHVNRTHKRMVKVDKLVNVELDRIKGARW